ncbi:hypothetical protein ACQEVZ_55455 [Dactylosporangium sp. CA-152071]|uniref:hypothetical protein n=1 Tax=Dactylosporangium sp. CA-152071 TaxID=3239933 RepID=UPI003D93D225
MTKSRTKSSTSPLHDRNEHTSGSDVASLVATTMSDLGGLFSAMDWAEDEIKRATRRHPDQADMLYHAFSLVQPRDIGTGMGAEFVYRAHVRELLERIAAGADTRIPTAAELCLVCTQVSLQVPLHGALAGLYFRMWLRAFPDRPIASDQAAEQVHYERLHGTQIDEYEAMLRRKAADPNRLLADIDCAGRHHGKDVTCRYATPPDTGQEDRQVTSA